MKPNIEQDWKRKWKLSQNLQTLHFLGILLFFEAENKCQVLSRKILDYNGIKLQSHDAAESTGRSNWSIWRGVSEVVIFTKSELVLFALNKSHGLAWLYLSFH